MNDSLDHSLAPVVRDDHSAPFFEAAAQGRLMLRWSPTSSAWSEPAARVCSHSQADDLEWHEASGRATVVTWTVKPRRPVDGVPGPSTVIVVVETEEGPWLTLQAPGADPAQLREGAEVRIGWVQPEGSEHLPVALL